MGTVVFVVLGSVVEEVGLWDGVLTVGCTGRWGNVVLGCNLCCGLAWSSLVGLVMVVP